VTYEGVPGLVGTKEAHGETTLVVDPARLREACTFLRDHHDFRFLSDIAATDYLGWGEKGVAGYVGNALGRDMHSPGSQGFSRVPAPKRDGERSVASSRGGAPVTPSTTRSAVSGASRTPCR